MPVNTRNPDAPIFIKPQYVMLRPTQFPEQPSGVILKPTHFADSEQKIAEVSIRLPHPQFPRLQDVASPRSSQFHEIRNKNTEPTQFLFEQPWPNPNPTHPPEPRVTEKRRNSILSQGLYATDEFRMFVFKVQLCNTRKPHAWTQCPFAHPGEKAQRRNPRIFKYRGSPCPWFRLGNCVKGESCNLAHGVFEIQLHPDNYRTHICTLGGFCDRDVCFFAHTAEELRLVPIQASSMAGPYHDYTKAVSQGPRAHRVCQFSFPSCPTSGAGSSRQTQRVVGGAHGGGSTLQPQLMEREMDNEEIVSSILDD